MQSRFCFFALRGLHTSLIRVDEATYDEMLPQCSATFHATPETMAYVLWTQHDPANPPPVADYEKLDALIPVYWEAIRRMKPFNLAEFARIAERLVAEGLAYGPV